MKSMWEKPMAGWRSRFLALALTAGAALPVWADNAVQAITSSQQAGAEVIRVEMSEPLTALPAGFTVQAPPRDRDRPSGRDERDRQVERRHQPGQPALGQRGAVG